MMVLLGPGRGEGGGRLDKRKDFEHDSAMSQFFQDLLLLLSFVMHLHTSPSRTSPFVE